MCFNKCKTGFKVCFTAELPLSMPAACLNDWSLNHGPELAATSVIRSDAQRYCQQARNLYLYNI